MQRKSRQHERPSIGVLLCATKDDDVVEYALARTTSPTLVAEYQAMLPPKVLLRRKLHELYARLVPEETDGKIRLNAQANLENKPIPNQEAQCPMFVNQTKTNGPSRNAPATPEHSILTG